jgi:uncharacterized protein (TIRG00374 family)
LSIKRGTRLRGIGRWLPGVLISGVAIWLLTRVSDWDEVIKAASTLNLALLIPAVLFFFVSLGLRALSWRTILQYKAPYGRVFITLNEGYLLNNIFPFRLGELGRAYLLSQSTQLSGFFILSTIVIERAYDLAIAAGLLLATLPLVLGIESSQAIAITVMILVLLGLLTMYLLAKNRQWIKTRLYEISLNKPSIKERILPRLDSLIEGLEALTRLDQFLFSILLLLLSWTFGAIELYIICVSFGVAVEWWWIPFVLGVISIGIALPSAPAGLGVYEIAMVGAFSLLGVPTSQALGIAVVSHLVNIVITSFIGVIGIFQDGESISRLYQRLLDLRNIERV